MLRPTFTTLNKYPLIPRLLRGSINNPPQMLGKYGVITQIAESSSGTDSKQCQGCEKCKRIIELLFKTENYTSDIKKQTTDIDKIEEQTQFDNCSQNCGTLLAGNIIDNANQKRVVNTSSDQHHRKNDVEQKIEYIPDNPCAEATLSENLNGNSQTNLKFSQYNYQVNNAELELQSRIEDIAKKCLQSPENKIDENIIAEIDKIDLKQYPSPELQEIARAFFRNFNRPPVTEEIKRDPKNAKSSCSEKCATANDQRFDDHLEDTEETIHLQITIPEQQSNVTMAFQPQAPCAEKACSKQLDVSINCVKRLKDVIIEDGLPENMKMFNVYESKSENNSKGSRNRQNSSEYLWLSDKDAEKHDPSETLKPLNQINNIENKKEMTKSIPDSNKQTNPEHDNSSHELGVEHSEKFDNTMPMHPFGQENMPTNRMHPYSHGKMPNITMPMHLYGHDNMPNMPIHPYDDHNIPTDRTMLIHPKSHDNLPIDDTMPKRANGKFYQYQPQTGKDFNVDPVTAYQQFINSFQSSPFQSSKPCHNSFKESSTPNMDMFKSKVGVVPPSDSRQLTDDVYENSSENHEPSKLKQETRIPKASRAYSTAVDIDISDSKVSLQELLRIVRQRSRMEMIASHVVGKCDRDKVKPQCPPPPPACPPKTPVNPCPPPKDPCKHKEEIPCVPKEPLCPPKEPPFPPICPPKESPCDPPCPPKQPPCLPKNPPCPPKKKSPCDKFKKSSFCIPFDTIFGTPLLFYSLSDHTSNVTSTQGIAYVLKDYVKNEYKPMAMRDVVASEFESIVTASNYKPWVPIPSWPIPEDQKKKKVTPPPIGCKLIPPPRLSNPCKENPCKGLPKGLPSIH